MNLAEKRKKLILFLTLCLCILGIFIFVISKTNSSSAVADHEHTYSGPWYYMGNGNHSKKCDVAGCTKDEVGLCMSHTIYLTFAELEAEFIDMGISIPSGLSPDKCYAFCTVCHNVNQSGKFVPRASEHDFVPIPYDELEDHEKTAATGTCRIPGTVFKRCSRCGYKSPTPFQNEINPNNHSFRLGDYASNADSHWRICDYCGRSEGIATKHNWGTPEVYRLNSYYDIAYVDINKSSCSDCGRTKYTTIDPVTECANSVDGYHHWFPTDHEEYSGGGGYLFYKCHYCIATCQRSFTRRL